MRYIPFDRLPDLHDELRRRIRNGNLFERRDSIAIVLALHGMRVGEIVAAKRKHLAVAENRLHVPRFKRSRPRDVPLDESLIEAIIAWREETGSDEIAKPLLYTTNRRAIHPNQLRRAFAKISHGCIGQSFRFHACRHTAAMRCYAETKDLLLVQKLLGHRSIATTEIYAQTLNQIPAKLMIKV